MRFAKDDLVLIEASVFPDKVGKVGIVTSVDPGWDNPYQVDVPGDSTSRFEGGELRRITVQEALRRLNGLAGEIDALSRRVEAVEEAVAPAP